MEKNKRERVKGRKRNGEIEVLPYTLATVYFFP